VASDEVICVIAVRNRFVTTIGAVRVILWVSSAGVIGSASLRICGIDGQDVLVGMPSVLMMQVSRVKIIRVAFVRNRGMTTARAVGMGFRMLAM